MWSSCMDAEEEETSKDDHFPIRDDRVSGETPDLTVTMHRSFLVCFFLRSLFLSAVYQGLPKFSDDLQGFL